MPKIMFIDDDVRILRLLGFLFASKGFSTLGIEKGRQSIENIRSGVPDIIIQELNLSDIHGIDLLKSIKMESRSIPVIILSASNDYTTIKEAIEEGASAHFGKPFKPAELYEKVMDLLPAG